MESPNDKVKLSFHTTQLRKEKLRYLSRRDGMSMEELLDHALGWLLRRRGHSIYGTTALTEIELPQKKENTDNHDGNTGSSPR